MKIAVKRIANYDEKRFLTTKQLAIKTDGWLLPPFCFAATPARPSPK
jgi:hypothetical protein